MKGLTKHNIFFIGIGGIGMSALARWFNANNFEVLGYDKTATNLTNKLIEEGISVYLDDSLNRIPKSFRPDNTLVIYTPAIPASQCQLQYFLDNNFEVKKRAEVLGIISENMFTVAVAGTHGKTTTSSMIAHILKFSGVDTTAFIGGISTNYNTNLILGKTAEAIAVIEADEYDKSFLQLSPDIEVITSVDADHLDIYGDEENMRTSFKQFHQRLKVGGKCIISSKAQDALQLDDVYTYGNDAKISANNLHLEAGKYRFDYVNGTRKIEDIQLNLPGEYNAENAIAAITVATSLGVTDANIVAAFESFKGVKRRFEYILEIPEVTFIDDYAHHPTEIEAFIGTLKSLYPDKFIQVIFQPHLYSRTRDFSDAFATSLSLADSVILTAIYPAREEPIAGITSELILSKIKIKDKKLLSEKKILEQLSNKLPDVLATIGAGSIDKLVPKIKNLITKTYAL